MTRPTYDLAALTIEGSGGDTGYEGLWADHNSHKGTFVKKPVFIETEEPGTGTSGRSLPSEHRTTPVVFVYDNSSIQPEWNDVMWNSKDYDATVRMEIVVSNEMDGRTGKEMRNAVVNVLDNITEANSAPAGGVFGSDWRSVKVTNIDRTPTRFGSHWRAYYDVEYGALGVI